MNENGFSRTLTLKNSIYLGLSSMIGAGLFNNIALTLGNYLSPVNSKESLFYCLSLSF